MMRTTVMSPRFSPMDRDDGLGWKFWATIFGGILVVCVGGFVFFLVLGFVWYAWGALGALIVGMLLVTLIAWIVDRRRTA
jgi:hypothetical protein